MNTQTPTTTRAATPSARRLRIAGLVVVVSLGITACDSQPSVRRVAEDLVNTLTEPGPKRDCMLDKLDDYTNDQLKEITASAQATGPGTAMDQFEADLASC